MRHRLNGLVLVCWLIVLLVSTMSGARASSSGRYLYDLDPYEVNPKSWAIWRQSVSADEWQEWCHELNESRYNWWRQSMSPQNWQHWKEKMGPADKALWKESSQMLPQILAREAQEEPAQHFKQKVLKLKVTGTVLPKQQQNGTSPTKGDKSSGGASASSGAGDKASGRMGGK